MKRYLFPLLLCIAGCNGNDVPVNGKSMKTEFRPPVAGTVVAADSMRIMEDQLNEQYFSVAVYATDSSISGTYDIAAYWGYNLATSSIRLPYGGEHFKPLLRKGEAPYTYELGFHFDGDTVFHEYYGITARKGQIAMQYLKAYTLQ